MNHTVVIYESKYGSTARYANWLAEEFSCPVFTRKSFRPQMFASYDTIIYGGGLYAGGVSGIQWLSKHWDAIASKRVLLFTCGLADPDEPKNAEHIRASLAKVLPADMLGKLPIFHLRGGIDYKRLSLLHRVMMAMMRNMLLKKDPAQLGLEDRQLLDTYGKYVDFTDRSAIQPILACARQQR